MNIVAKTRKWRRMAVWVTGALPPPHPPYPARRPDVQDAKHFPDGDSDTTKTVIHKCLRIVVAVDVDLRDSVEARRVLTASQDPGLEPRKPLMVASSHAVNVEESTNHLRCANRVDPLDMDLDGFNLAILVQVEHQVVDEVETIANNDERKLVSQLGLFEEVLDLLGVVVVAFAANPLNFADLASPCSSLNNRDSSHLWEGRAMHSWSTAKKIFCGFTKWSGRYRCRNPDQFSNAGNMASEVFVDHRFRQNFEVAVWAYCAPPLVGLVFYED
ncbi:hypothetical protein B0H14DRAFT_3718285, partial [Mycena olivaceomarginata]